jgi:hypothetical protein
MLRKILPIVAALSALPALASDGFVLTQWGRWTHEEAVRAVDAARAAGARHISVLIHLCQDSATANEMRWCEAGAGEPLRPSFQGQRLLRLAGYLKEHGLELSLIPFPRAEGLQSRQWINPSSRPDWFRNYGDRVEELGRLATELEAAELIVGSELTVLFADGRGWREVIRRVRGVYSGHLTISVVFATYPLIDFWDALDSIGISHYFPLSAFEIRPSVARLEAAARVHRAHLLAFARSQGKPLTFVEAGYPATEMAARRPWDYTWSERTLDRELQARCFEAFGRAWRGVSELRGARFWGLTAQSIEPEMGFNPLGKPAEEQVRAFFAERSRRP